MSRTTQETARLYWISSTLIAVSWIVLFFAQQRISWSLPVAAAYLAYRAYSASAPRNE